MPFAHMADSADDTSVSPAKWMPVPDTAGQFGVGNSVAQLLGSEGNDLVYTTVHVRKSLAFRPSLGAFLIFQKHLFSGIRAYSSDNCCIADHARTDCVVTIRSWLRGQRGQGYRECVRSPHRQVLRGASAGRGGIAPPCAALGDGYRWAASLPIGDAIS